MLSLARSHAWRLSVGRGLAAVLAFGALVWGQLASAQVTNITVTVNGVSSAPGTYDSANIFQATCEGTETTSSTSGDPAIFRLTWTVQSDDTIFWDTAADCNTGNTVTDDAGTVISGSDVTGPITIDPEETATSTGYGVGAGNVEIDMRTVFASAFPTIYGNIFDGGNPCVPPEQGTLYVCVTQEEDSTSTLAGTTQTTLAWYMAVTYDTFTPEAPSGVTGQSGDSNVIVGWDFSDVNFPSQDINFNVYYQPDPNGYVPDYNGVCGPATSDGDAGPNESGRSIWQSWGGMDPDAGDGGCPFSDEDNSGDCCGDAGVDDAGSCNPTAVINTPGVCDGCVSSNSECGGNNSCIRDDAGNPYCGASCSMADSLDAGGNLECPAGFQCSEKPDLSGTMAYVCVPANNLCIPAWIACGACSSNADCPTGSGECVDAGGGTWCAVPCLPDAGPGANLDGEGVCLGASSCQQVEDNGASNPLCALPSYDCYDPTLIGDEVVPDAGPVDAGSGGSGIDISGWQVAQFSGTLSTGQIGGLTNGICYDFVVETVVDDGTMGNNSSEVVVAPVKNYDFWRLYQLDGGGDTGGLHCQAGGGGLGVLGVLAALIGLRRRRPPEPRE
jgi:hypothetical protein